MRNVSRSALAVGQPRSGDLADKRRYRLRRILEQLAIEHSRRIELRDDLLVLDAHVLLSRIPSEQLLPGAQDVLVGGEHRHQRAERQAALDHQIAASRVEEERRDLREEVV